MFKEEMISQMNASGKRGEPFIFIIDFEMKNCIFSYLSHLSNEVFFFTKQYNHLPENTIYTQPFYFERKPVNYSIYQAAFNTVNEKIRKGYSYLTNLTFPTNLHTNLNLQEIFMRSNSEYKLFVLNNFVSFSPECFVKITDGIISSYPMKGTIDAAIPEAEHKILNDPKETVEHYIIVDLIRNDLSQVATDVMVERFRYIDKIATNEKTLLQISSAIRGNLPSDYRENIGDIIFALLPAGSVSGAPKPSTLDIIRSVELDCRNFYTGIWGIFDGTNLDSAVIIRYIEETREGLIFRSGGGITANSKDESEYQELIDKVYVPFT
jgi:para-aminobenzoate synthetase component 1